MFSCFLASSDKNELESISKIFKTLFSKEQNLIFIKSIFMFMHFVAVEVIFET